MSKAEREHPAFERKEFPLEIETIDRKQEGDREYGIFEGYASTWDLDQMGDTIRRGAFARTLDHWSRKANRLPVLWQHRSDEPIGVTVEASEDDRGLRIKGRLLLGIQRAREAYEAALEKALGGLSIGFSIPRDGADWNDDGTRVIREVRLFEYSFVTWPANEAAVFTGVKATDPVMLELLEAIRGLRDETRGLHAETRSVRKALLSGDAGANSHEARGPSALDTLLAETLEARSLLADKGR